MYLLWLTCTKVFNKVELLQYFLLIDLHEQFPSLNWHRYCPHKIFSEHFSQEYCLLFDLHRLGILEPCDNPVRHCLTPNLCQSVQNEQGIVKTSDNIQTLGPPAIIKVFVSSVRSSYSHPDLLLIHHPPHHPLFQITPVFNTGLSLSEPLQLYKGYNAI